MFIYIDNINIVIWQCFWKKGQCSWVPNKYKCIFEGDWTEESNGFVVLIDLVIRNVFGIIAYIGQDNLSLFLMQIYHKFPCPIYVIIPITVSVVGFYWNHKALAGGRRVGENKEKVELGASFWEMW